MTNAIIMKAASKKQKVYPATKETISEVSEYATAYLPVRKAGFKDFIYSDMDVHSAIKKGVSKKVLDNTLVMMGISTDEMSTILHISERTLRRYTEKSVLSTEQSERILELNKLYHYGEEVLGSLSTFKLWMDSTLLALGQKKPKEFLDTSIGIKLLMNLLGRIEHGVYS